MDHPIAEEESYADRRQLFKNIWETPLNIDKKEAEMKERNAAYRAKVIKTVRIADDVIRCKTEKKKKERLRNLRIVCNKLLHYCERQEADNIFYDQLASKEWETSMRIKGRKPRKSKVKRTNKFNRERWQSMFIRQDVSQTGITSPDSQLKSSRASSSSKVKETSSGAPEHYRGREKRRRLSKFPDPKDFIPPCDKYPHKRLFPINKILIR